jgi:SAM-dependent methyltransferase
MASEPDARAVHPLVDLPTFDACYYARSCGRPYKRDAEWLAFFGGIADRIAADIRPRRVLDAGCALGLLVETLRERGIEAFGIDVSEFAIAHVYEPIKAFCSQGSITEPLPEQERYDLIVCIEVLEHMTAAEAEAAIANFCAHSYDILFSSSPTHYGEATHLNIQPPGYWAAQFALHEFYRDIDFDASFILPWAARFRHRTDPPYRIVADYERGFSQVVIERNELRALAVATQAEISRITQAREEAETREGLARAELDALTHELAQVRARARATISLMERSWFWRARRPWAWISRRMGRPT